MLNALVIRNVVLIDRLDIAFAAGLTALTGETGAGKSIILDALGLALGMRGAKNLVRAGTDQASVSAVFTLPSGHPVFAHLADAGVEGDASEDLVLRRTLGADGRSRAFINDQPVSVRLLQDIGTRLLEIHGQHDGHGLLNAATHRPLLDGYAGLHDEVTALGALWTKVQKARDHRDDLLARREEMDAQSDFVRMSLEELNRLDPKPDEEQGLADERAFLMLAHKLAEKVDTANAILNAGSGIEAGLSSALGALEQALAQLEGGAQSKSVKLSLERSAQALERALIETGEAASALDDAGQALDVQPDRMDQAEERLFALRAAARKHNVTVDGLADLRAELTAQLESVESLADDEKAARAALAKAQECYDDKAQKLAAKRGKAGKKLEQMLAKELPPLKMEKARFAVRQTMLDTDRCGPGGCDQIHFEVSTNPGTPFGPLGGIASGGELSRFSLALKASLANKDGPQVMIFDEIDQGVGGAVADAVGRRLAGLSAEAQVLVVTHSPQVAARADTQLRIEKQMKGDATLTHLRLLDDGERTEEIARMLAGADVTDAARAAAQTLLQGA
ncbi:MAG: DNA repair protein RecN [Robiginitomaculum sp.]|nr:MAG: DNA repair protein RecN [Robiginitomaculum sp.]